METTNQDNQTSQAPYNELTTTNGKWHYKPSFSRELLEENLITPLVTIGNSSSSILTETSVNKWFTDYLADVSPQCHIHVRKYHSTLISRYNKGKCPALQAAQWLQTAHNCQLPCPELLAWSDTTVATGHLGRTSEMAELLKQYRKQSPPARYPDDLPQELAEILRQSGNLAGLMHKAGLTLTDFSAGSIIYRHESATVSLFDLHTMYRCASVNSENLFDESLCDNLAMPASEIYQACGEAGLEIFIQGYLHTAVSDQNLFRQYYNHIHTLARYQQAKRYEPVDKLALANNEYFQQFRLSDNFHARVFLQSREPVAFSPISEMSFTVEQWRKVLEPLVLSKKLFTSKKLVLHFPDRELAVSIEGGPGKEIIGKWQLGHCLINRGIDTPWPLALVMYQKQAVLITEKKKDNTDRTYRNILIVKPSALGDVARAIPTLTALREKYPHARISWLVCPEYADLVKYHPAVDEVILFDKKKFKRMNLSTLRWARKYSQALFGCRFDLVLDMQGLLRSGLITGSTKSPTRIGYRRARELAWLFYTKKVDTPVLNHSNDDCWRIALAAGITSKRLGYGLPVHRDGSARAAKLLAESGLRKNESYISILPGGTADEKIWKPSYFGELAKEIYQEFELRSVILGAGKRECELARTIVETAGSDVVINLVGKTTLAEMTTIIGNSILAVGNDSGPLHIAAAIPVTVVGIYGPTNPLAVGPVNQLDNVVEAGYGYERIGRYSKDPHHEINNIAVQEVYAKVYDLLTSRK